MNGQDLRLEIGGRSCPFWGRATASIRWDRNPGQFSRTSLERERGAEVRLSGYNITPLSRMMSRESFGGKFSSAVCSILDSISITRMRADVGLTIPRFTREIGWSPLPSVFTGCWHLRLGLRLAHPW